VKAAAGISGAKLDAVIGANIEAASESVERELAGRRFIPQTETRYYPWPQPRGQATVLFLDQDLLAVTLLQARAQNASPVTIPATDYFLEPINEPPYRRIEIDLSSTGAFEAGDTTQRSIAVTGRWAYRETTKAAGLTQASGDGSQTTLTVTDASLVDVGDTLLIGSEQMFVSGRSTFDTTANLTQDLTESMSDVSVVVNNGTLVKAGEVILIESERMLVESISGNTLTVQRAYDGSVLAAHTQPLDVYAFRTLTVVRGVNGTTAAAFGAAATIVKYAPPATVVKFCRAEAILGLKQDESGWTGQMGGGEGTINVRAINIGELRERLLQDYGLVSL
jgi:hypothetical protein